MTSLPIANARLERMERTGATYMWIVPRCPMHHKEHYHWGGIADGDPREHLGRQRAYCGDMDPLGSTSWWKPAGRSAAAMAASRRERGHLQTRGVSPLHASASTSGSKLPHSKLKGA